MILVQAGSPLPIVLQLGTGDTGLFVRCRLFNQAGAQIAQVSLTEIGNGLYYDFSQLKDAENFTVAQFRVFDDAGFTIQNVNNQDSVEIFVKQTIDISTLQGGETVKGIVTDNEVIGKLEVNGDLKGIVEDTETKGVVLDDETLRGIADDNEIKGKTDGC